MKKVIILALSVLLSVSVFAGNYEIGARVGYIDFDEEILDSGVSYGAETIYNINNSMRVRASVDFYNNDNSSSESFRLADSWSDSWSDSYYKYTATYSYDYTYNYIYNHEIDYMPVFFSFEYLWDLDKFKVYAGIGLGYSFNDYDYDLTGTFVNNITGDVAALSTPSSGSADNSFIYGVTTGFDYSITDKLSVAFDLAYTFGEVDYDYEIGSSSFSNSLDLDHYSVNIICKYKIGQDIS